ncbi:MAG: hypothetical protein LBE31_10735 [Deltaproteobacteria bacterium]|jgi:hypothetical protein|nr:hypothetical protein [Deltaproteobacteria bacterium]
MASIAIIKERHYIRIYRVFSYRDSNKKPKNVRKAIGKIDPNTNKPVFNQYFLDLIKEQGVKIDFINSIPIHDIPKFVDFGTFTKPIELLSDNKIFYRIDSQKIVSMTDILESKILGPHLILKKIAQDTSLLSILQNNFPEYWDKIITLAFYLVYNNDPGINLQDWAKDNVTYFNTLDQDPQYIYTVIAHIRNYQINSFYRALIDKLNESKYLVLAIKQNIPYRSQQFNICFLLGEQSGLPVYSTHKSKGLTDDDFLRSFLYQLSTIEPENSSLVKENCTLVKEIGNTLNDFVNNLLLNPLDFDVDDNSKSKLFIASISIFIFIYIHKIISQNPQCSKFTVTSLLESLTKIKSFENNGLKYFQVPTKENINILESFGINILE